MKGNRSSAGTADGAVMAEGGANANTLGGSDGGNRVFDILVDGVKIATERLENNRPGEFYDQIYPIPEALQFVDGDGVAGAYRPPAL